MRKILSLFLISFLVISCKENTEKFAKTDVVSENNQIYALLDNWHLAATEANYNNYFSKMDSLSIFIGTDASENWSKTEFESFSKPYFDDGKAWDFKAIERNIYLNDDGNFAWFDELLNTWMGVCRGSGVLEKKDEKWKLKHYVLSVSIPNEEIQKVIDIKKEKDSIFLSKFK